ncbi:MAG: cysteine--tRNA ligase [Elusimicrobia bacterium HGW-Elusimicrobia-4]|nr:MAG: cysteine--tRNA ligase [Elusimicrobia bacterium HGW-Elusimicrobia-4]
MLKIYNTLSGKKEEFVPVDKNGKNVNMYICGITPYDEVHLGHARCYVVFDVIRRYLKYKGYNVKYVQNFTDVDDKIINRSKQLAVSSEQLAEKYINDYFTQMKKLNIQDADSCPRVTQKIPEIIEFIKKIIDNGYGYAAAGDVYFSVRKFKDYGKLSKRNVDDLKSGSRVLPGEQKKDPLDFSLWKKAKEGEPSWDSPWGKGRPGWHIECSAMSLNEFGFDTFDIHGGGQDLIFPHHENEIAQSESALGKPFVKYWIHNGFVTINKEKMSKSLGNFFTLREIFEKYDPMIVRYMLLSQHYRQPLDFSEDKLEQAKSAYEKITGIVGRTDHIKPKQITALPDSDLIKQINNFNSGMQDDFNSAGAIASIQIVTNCLNKYYEDYIENPNDEGCREYIYLYRKELLKLCNILGFTVEQKIEIQENILKLVEEREHVRKEKNWKLSDEIREKIKKEGFEVEDTKFGPKLKKL